MTNPINPDHYRRGPHALEDARKCRWYIDRLIAKLEG